jgi:KDO2-lipid IV(A) lauroyltransferase
VAGIDAQEPTREAVARGRGCVSITAHLGNWELAGRALGILGRPVHIVMAPEIDPAVEALLANGGHAGVRFVRLTSPIVGAQLVAALRRGDIVAFQLDRAIGGRGRRHSRWGRS